MKLAGRYALLAVLAYVMIARLRLHPIGLVVGASSLVGRRLVRSRALARAADPGAPTERAAFPHARMEKLHHELWIVTAANQLFGPAVGSLLDRSASTSIPAHAIPDYLVMCAVIVVAAHRAVPVRPLALSVENPGTLQIVLEDVVGMPERAS